MTPLARALARAERLRRWRETVSLARSRLAQSMGGRVGRAATWLLLIAYGGGAVVQRFTEATPTDVLGYAPSAARTAAWFAAGPIALAAAHARERRDDQEGIAALAAASGVARPQLRLARLAAVIVACAGAVAIPSFGTAIVASLLQPSPLDALEALPLFPALALFAGVAGGTLGLAAVTADRVAPDRGRSAFLTIVLVPWAVADAFGWHGASIPGALDAVLTSALAVLGLGRLA